MTEREQPPFPAGYRPVPDDDWREQTTPGLSPAPGPGTAPGYDTSGYRRPDYGRPGYSQPTYQQPGYDQSRYGRPGYAQPRYAGVTAPDYSGRPVAVRRPDALAAVVLVLAGIAAGASLLLHWLARSQETGWTLLRDGLQDVGTLFRTGMWQPVAIVVGGALLFVVGLLVLVPARAHRTLGLLALLLTAAVAAGVLVPLERAGWRLSVFDIGFFCAIGVAVLGLIGSLKALFTGPRLR